MILMRRNYKKIMKKEKYCDLLSDNYLIILT